MVTTAELVVAYYHMRPTATLREIGTWAGVSRERVRQILTPLGLKRKIVPTAKAGKRCKRCQKDIENEPPAKGRKRIYVCHACQFEARKRGTIQPVCYDCGKVGYPRHHSLASLAEHYRCRRCHMRYWSTRRKRPAKKSPRSISASVRYRVLERDRFCCRYCGAGADEGAVLHIDHIVPVASGGTSDFDNLASACTDCNAGKRDRQINLPSQRG